MRNWEIRWCAVPCFFIMRRPGILRLMPIFKTYRFSKQDYMRKSLWYKRNTNIQIVMLKFLQLYQLLKIKPPISSIIFLLQLKSYSASPTLKNICIFMYHHIQWCKLCAMLHLLENIDPCQFPVAFAQIGFILLVVICETPFLKFLFIFLHYHYQFLCIFHATYQSFYYFTLFYFNVCYLYVVFSWRSEVRLSLIPRFQIYGFQTLTMYQIYPSHFSLWENKSL